MISISRNVDSNRCNLALFNYNFSFLALEVLLCNIKYYATALIAILMHEMLPPSDDPKCCHSLSDFYPEDLDN